MWLFACSDQGALERGFFAPPRPAECPSISMQLLGPMGLPFDNTVLLRPVAPVEVAVEPRHVLEELTGGEYLAFSANGVMLHTPFRSEWPQGAMWPPQLLDLCPRAPHAETSEGACVVVDWMRSESPPRLWHYLRLPASAGAEASVSLHVMLLDQAQRVLADTWLNLELRPPAAVLPHMPRPPRLLVCTGGVASSALLAAAGLEHHADALARGAIRWNKHERDPMAAQELGEAVAGTRVLYVFADPFNTVAYFLQRCDNLLRSLRFHCEMMGCRLPEIERLILQDRRSKEDVLCGLAQPPLPDTEGGGGGGDLLQLEHHFRSWWEHSSRKYDIMFIRYEALATHRCRSDVARFLDSPHLLHTFTFRPTIASSTTRTRRACTQCSALFAAGSSRCQT